MSSIPIETQRTEEAMFIDLTNMVELCEWKNARSYIAKIIDNEFYNVAKQMNDYYEIKKCQLCLGTETLVQGDFDDQVEKPCICQI